MEIFRPDFDIQNLENSECNQWIINIYVAFLKLN